MDLKTKKFIKRPKVDVSSGKLTFYTLMWEKYDDEEEEEEENKKYNKRNIIIRTYGLTQNGSSVCLEIKGFQPYFMLRLPDFFRKNHIQDLVSQIKEKIYRKYEVHYKVVRMKKLYYYDGNKKYKFLKILFDSESARYTALKALVPRTSENISPSEIKIQKTIPIWIYYKKYEFLVYETRQDSIIRFLHISGVKPCGIISVDIKKLESSFISTTCQITKRVHWKNIIKSDEEWIPPFRVSSFDIECTRGCGDNKFPQACDPLDEIIQIGTTTRFVGDKYCKIRHIVTTKKSESIPDIIHPDGTIEKAIVESVSCEKNLLLRWRKHIQRIDTDIFIGYNINTFDWKYICDRSKLLGCYQKTFQIGRLKNTESKMIIKKLSSSALGNNVMIYPNINGRLQIDLLPEIRKGHKLTSYKLDNVSDKILNLRKNDLPPNKIFSRYKRGTPEDIRVIAEYCIQDCILVNDLFDKLCILINCIEMSNVCIIPIDLLFTRGQGIKSFSKITEKCLQNNTAFPTLVNLEHGNSSTIGYEGAIVLKPIAGFYDTPIVVLDYASLYPSSIIEYNISFETILKDNKNFRNIKQSRYNEVSYNIYSGKGKDKKKVGVKNCIFVEHLVEKINEGVNIDMIPNLNGKGIIPSLLQDLLKERSKAKKQMKETKDSFKKSVFNGKQLALKITANSVYGYLGAKFSELRFIDLASCTTSVGRDKIYFAKNEVEKNFKECEVVYGDTDSVFIKISNCKELKGKNRNECIQEGIKIGYKMEHIFDTILRKPQKLEYEKIFFPFLIFSKKRYTGKKYETTHTKHKLISMGLVTKRRDNAPIVKKIYNGILDILFNSTLDKAIKIRNSKLYYQSEAKNLLDGNVDIKLLVVSKTLKTGYVDPTKITHKVLAERIKERDPGNAPKSNDRIPFVFIDPTELKCSLCNKKVSINDCKCRRCMKLYCSSHINRHSKHCVHKCRMCWLTDDSVRICQGECKGCYCSKHRSIHKCQKITTKILQGDLAETPSFIIANNLKINYRYYLDNQIRKPVEQIFELLEENNVLNHIITKDNNKRNKVRDITDFFKPKKDKKKVSKYF